jgi:hypothetical protein
LRPLIAAGRQEGPAPYCGGMLVSAETATVVADEAIAGAAT